MANSKRLQIMSQPGIRRDGTAFDSDHYNDGMWVRFYRGRPKKMGGYYASTAQAIGPIRLLYPNFYNNFTWAHAFGSGSVDRIQFNDNGGIVTLNTRTITGISSNSANLWTADTVIDVSGGSAARLVCHAARPGTTEEETSFTVFYGDLNANTALATTGQTCSGGVVVLHPYTFIYGSNGMIKNSIAGNPAVWTGGEANEANVAGTQIQKGMSMRGSGQSPAGLFWSRESLIRVSFVGGTALWKYDVLTNQIALISRQATIEYDGTFFWLGVDRFYVFDGQVKELTNQMNLNWFFENLDWTNRHRIWAMKMPRWGEIWWFFPSVDSDGECDKAIIFNLREKTWYDAAIRRTAGCTPVTFRYPLLADPDPNVTTGKYKIWAHDKGTDAVDLDAGKTSAVESYFETTEFGLTSGGPTNPGAPEGLDRWTRVVRIEPDFKMTGEMDVTVRGKNYPQGDEVVSSQYAFDQGTEKIDLREQRRTIRLRFRSATVGGDYEMGKPLIHIEPGDVRG